MIPYLKDRSEVVVTDYDGTKLNMVDGEIIHSDTEEQLGAYTWEESEDQQ